MAVTPAYKPSLFSLNTRNNKPSPIGGSLAVCGLKTLKEMDLNQIIQQVQKQYGAGIDAGQVTKLLEGVDLKNLDFSQIVAMLAKGGLIGDLDGDGKVEPLAEEIKGKAEQMLGGNLGGLFGKILGK